MKILQIRLDQLYKEISDYECLLTCYVPDNFEAINPNKKRPAMLIFPGGSYGKVSEREAEPVALKFISEGFAAFVLTYSIANSGARFPVQLLQACFAMKYIKDNSHCFNIDGDKIFALGFSAGAHLCGSLGLLYESKYVQAVICDYQRLRPAALIFCYPVVSSGEYAHKLSFENLLKDSCLKDEVSLENAVNKNSPPAFIWHTFDDNSVPVFNTLLLAEQYAKNNVPVELHIFEKGVHGLSLADLRTAPLGDANFVNTNAAVWIDLLFNYLKDKI